MNLLQLLQVPWRSSHLSLRVFATLVFLLCAIGAFAVDLFVDEPERWLVFVMLYGAGLFFVWAFLLSTSLLLAIDARQLRMPNVQRRILLSLGLYGVLGLAPPIAMLALSGQPVWHGAVMLALSGAGGLAFALAPRYVSMFIGLMPSLLHTIWQRFFLPGIVDPRFVWCSAGALCLLLVFNALRWRQLLLGTCTNGLQGWSAATVMQFRQGGWGRWNSLGDSRQLRQRPDWLRSDTDLKGVGPARPGRTLRVALGGWYLPQTAISYVKQLALLSSIVILPLTIILLINRSAQDGMAAEFLRGILIGLTSSLSLMAGPLACLLSLLWLWRRWQRVNAELPLLALLPGLGSTGKIKRQLLRTALGLPLGVHALAVLGLAIAMLCRPGLEGLLFFALLGQLGFTAITVATVLNVFGGHMPAVWKITALFSAAFLLGLLSAILPAMTYGHHPVAWAGTLLPLLGLAWLVLGITMYGLGRRGWRDLMQRPHPFLPC